MQWDVEIKVGLKQKSFDWRHFYLYLFSAVFISVKSDYSREGIENKPICETCKLWASRKSQCKAI
jgi:hypothetical protein